jgi:hypothetical protein
MKKPSSREEEEELIGKKIVNTQSDSWNGYQGTIIEVSDLPGFATIQYNLVPPERETDRKRFITLWEDLELLGPPNERNRCLLQRKQITPDTPAEG